MTKLIVELKTKMKYIAISVFLIFFVLYAEAIYCKKGILSHKEDKLKWCEGEKCYIQLKVSRLRRFYRILGCLTVLEAEELATKHNQSAIKVHSMAGHYGPDLNICGYNYCNQPGRVDYIPQFLWQQIYNLFSPLV